MRRWQRRRRRRRRRRRHHRCILPMPMCDITATILPFQLKAVAD